MPVNGSFAPEAVGPHMLVGAPPTFTSRRLLGAISLTALVRQDSDISHLWPLWPKAVPLSSWQARCSCVRNAKVEF